MTSLSVQDIFLPAGGVCQDMDYISGSNVHSWTSTLKSSNKNAMELYANLSIVKINVPDNPIRFIGASVRARDLSKFLYRRVYLASH